MADLAFPKSFFIIQQRSEPHTLARAASKYGVPAFDEGGRPLWSQRRKDNPDGKMRYFHEIADWEAALMECDLVLGARAHGATPCLTYRAPQSEGITDASISTQDCSPCMYTSSPTPSHLSPSR